MIAAVLFSPLSPLFHLDVHSKVSQSHKRVGPLIATQPSLTPGEVSTDGIASPPPAHVANCEMAISTLSVTAAASFTSLLPSFLNGRAVQTRVCHATLAIVKLVGLKLRTLFLCGRNSLPGTFFMQITRREEKRWRGCVYP